MGGQCKNVESFSFKYSLMNWQLHWEYLGLQELDDKFDDTLVELAE